MSNFNRPRDGHISTGTKSTKKVCYDCILAILQLNAVGQNASRLIKKILILRAVIPAVCRMRTCVEQRVRKYSFACWKLLSYTSKQIIKANQIILGFIYSEAI
jgi:hypothetical protein